MLFDFFFPREVASEQYANASRYGNYNDIDYTTELEENSGE